MPNSGRSSFAARFGRVILQHGIAALPSALYHFGSKLDLYAQHIWFISYILSHKWDEDLPYPSLGVMARCSGMSKRQLQRYSDELREMGYLLVYPRVSQERGQESNAYDFAPLFGHLEACIIEQRKDLQSAGMSNPAIGVPVTREHASQAGATDQTEDTWASLNELERSERDTSFVARYGRVITRYGVAAVPRALFTCSAGLGMTPQQVWFVAYIFSYQWDTALPYPSIMRMAALTGYTPAYLHRLKASLVERDYLRLVHRTKADGGQDSNAYDFSPLLEEIGKLLQPPAAPQATRTEDPAEDPTGPTNDDPRLASRVERRPRRGSLAARQRHDRQADLVSTKEELRATHATNGRNGKAHKIGGDIEYMTPRDSPYSGPNVTEYRAEDDMKYRGVRDTGYIPPNAAQYTDPGDTQFAGPATEASQRPMTKRLEAPTTLSEHEVEAKHPEKDEEDDLSQPSLSKGANGNGSHSEHSNYIAQVITDFSYELGDQQHVIANAGQALRLWRSSSLDEHQFVEMMYNAKRSTREAQGKHGASGLSNKMAYFFACLRRLVQ